MGRSGAMLAQDLSGGVSTPACDRTALVEEFTPTIRYHAATLKLRLPPNIDMDDLVSSGVVGLLDAASRFDSSRGIKFKTYAEFRIKGAMLDELRSLDWIPRSVRKKSHRLENAYAQLQKSLGRPAEAEEVAEFMDLEIGELYKLLDETKTVSVVALEEGRTVEGHVVLPQIRDANHFAFQGNAAGAAASVRKARSAARCQSALIVKVTEFPGR